MNALKILLLAILSLTTAFAAPPTYRETGAGLRTNLTTGAARVVQGRADFRAAMAVTNLSRVEFAFNLNGDEMYPTRFVFRLQNAAGEILWQSDPRVETPATKLPYQTIVLKPRTTWQQVVTVPLVIDSAPLSPGRYRLSAYLPNNGDIAAQTLLEVVPPAPAERQMQGVTGVIKRSLSTLVRVSTLPDRFRTDYVVEPVAGIRIEARGARAGSSAWTVITAVSDANGTFVLPLEPGLWDLTAIDPTAPSVSMTVTISARQWMDKGVLWVVDDEVATQDGSSGVSGLVTSGYFDRSEPANYVEVPGWGFQDARGLVRGGPVSIRKSETSAGTFPIDVWTGVTDEFGRFSAALPPGSYIAHARFAGQDPAGPFESSGVFAFTVKEGRTMRVRTEINLVSRNPILIQ